MSKQIFRQAALDRLASPEQSDRPHTLVSARSWLALLILASSVVAAAYWALTSYAPVKVPAKGIVLQKAGLREIVSDRAGRIRSMTIKAGDVVNVGMSIATFGRAEIEREIKQAQAELDDTRNRLSSLVQYYGRLKGIEEESQAQQRRALKESEQLVVRRQELLAKRIRGLGKLVRRKIVVNTTLINAELELATSLEKLSQLRDKAISLRANSMDRNSQRELALLDERLKVDRLERQIVRLQARLADEQVVTATHGGRAIEVKVGQGDVVSAGTALVTLAPLNTRNGDDVAVLYVAATEGKRVKAGMDVEIVPTVFQKAQYGFIKGKVLTVSTVPTTVQGMRRVLRNDRLAEQLSGGASPFEVTVAFQKDETTQSGVRWSSSAGPDSKVNPGTLLDATIVVERLPIADIVVPGLSSKLGMRPNG